MANIQYCEVKKAIKKDDLAGSFFGGMYHFAPYRSCEHGCRYCDGRAEKYYVEGDFEKDITVRKNLPDLLEKELTLLRERAPISIGSGVTDCYQPIEKDEMVMRRCGKILMENRFPVHIATKSSLISRDLDIWKKVNEKNGFTLLISLVYADDEDRRIFEPGASSVQERIETLKLFKDAGCSVGILMMPLLPYVSDSEESVTKLFEMIEDIDVDFIIPGYLTLRPGRQKDLYMEVIRKNFPDLEKSYEKLYAKERISGNPSYNYRMDFHKRIAPLLKGENTFFPHYIYRDRMPIYNEIHILLTHMCEIYSIRGVDTSNLKKSFDFFNNWLREEKKHFNRRRSLSEVSIDEKLRFLATTGNLEKIVKNEKLSNFMKKIILDRKVFDYTTLKLS